MKKTLVISGIVLVCLVGAFILFLPSILSSEVGKNFLIRNLEQKTDSKVELQAVSFSWTKAQQLEKFRMEKQGELLLTFDSLTLDVPFWNLIFRNGSLGTTRLVNPNLTLRAKTFNPTPPKPGKPITYVKEEKPKKALWSDPSGKIAVENGMIALQQAGTNLILIDQIDFALDMGKKTFPLSIQASGSTQHNQLLGHFQIKAMVNKKEEVIELATAEALEIDGETNFSNFPVVGIDAVISLLKPSLRGVLIGTFGDNLNLDLSLSKVQRGENISLKLRSPRMLVELRARYEKGLLQLTAPLRVVWTIKPLLMQFLKPNLPLVLIGDIHSELNLDKASLVFKNMKFNTKSLAAVGSLKMQRGAFALAKTRDSMLLDELDFSFNTTQLKELLSFSFQNTFRFSSFPQTTIQGMAQLRELFAQKDFTAKFAQLDLSIRNFPTALIDQMNPKEEKLQKWIGSNFDLTAKHFEDKGKHQLIVSGVSPLLKLSTTRFTMDRDLTLNIPTTFSYQLTPRHWEQLAHPITLNGSLESFLLPLEKKSIDWLESDVKISVKSQDIQLKNFLGLGRLQLPFLNCQFEGKPISSLHFNGSTHLDYSPGTWGLSLIGYDTELQAIGDLKVKDELEITPLQIILDGKKIKTTINSAFQSGAFILKKPLRINFMLEPNQINPILAKGGDFPVLSEQTPVNLQIKPGSFPLKKKALSEVEFQATGTINSLKMTRAKMGLPFSFNNVALDFDLDGNKKKSQLQFEAQAVDGGAASGGIELLMQSDKGEINPFKNPSHIRVQFNKLSSQIADALFQMRGTLPRMIGSWIDFHCDIKEKRQRQDIDINIDSSYLTLNGSFSAYDKFELKNNRNPLKIEWNVSEEGYQAYKNWRNSNKRLNSPTFTIKDRARISLSISPLSLPLKSKEGIFPKVDMNLYHGIFDADMRMNSLVFERGEQGEIAELERFDLNIRKVLAPGPLTFEMKGNVIAADSKKSGQIKGEGKLNDFLTPLGDIDLEDVTASIHARIQHLPSVFLDALSNINNPSGLPPSAFLGDLVNASFEAELIKENGRLNFDVDATSCRAIINGTVANGILYLDDPLKASMTISPKMNEILSRSAKVAVASMKNPISLVISEKGFAVPIKDLVLKNANLSYGRIDFGQIVCRNTGSTSDVSSIFKMTRDQNLISLWFAPMEFNIQNGLMYVDRTEILYNRAYQVALWGDIDFRRRYVSMILGLTAQSLRAALGIRGLDANYVLQVPVEGPFGKIRIDKGAATSKIALLVARKQIAPQAGVWGQVFGAIGGLADDQSDVPSPKPPFPWHGIVNMQDLTTTDSQLK